MTGDYFAPVVFYSGRNKLGAKLIYFAEVGSTNKWLMEHAEQEPEGAVVFTSSQIRGKGRFERVWEHGAGNLAMSFLLKLSLEDLQKPLALMIGLALQNFLAKKFEVKASIKWPNDILIQDKKVAGILCESRQSGKEQYHAVCGIGFNLQSANFTGQSFEAISLASVTSKKIAPFQCLEWIIEEIEILLARFKNDDLGSAIKQWEKESGMMGKNISYLKDSQYCSGTVLGINNDGSLIVKNLATQKLENLNSGEIQILKR